MTISVWTWHPEAFIKKGAGGPTGLENLQTPAQRVDFERKR